MSIEQKNEKNRKCSEARQRNKGLSIEPLSSRGDEKLIFFIVIPTCLYYTKLMCSFCKWVIYEEDVNTDQACEVVSFPDGCSTIDFTNLSTQDIAGITITIFLSHLHYLLC